MTRTFAEGVAAAGIDVAAELDKFRNYPHREEVRSPDRAFIAWLKKALSFNAGKRSPNAEPASEGLRRTSEAHVMIAAIKAFSQEHAEQFDRLRRYMETHRWWEKSSREWQVQQMHGAIIDRDMIFAFLEDEGREC